MTDDGKVEAQATRSVRLWIDSDKDSCVEKRAMQEFLKKKGEKWTEKVAEEFGRRQFIKFSNLTPDNQSLDDVDWEALADSWNKPEVAESKPEKKKQSPKNRASIPTCNENESK